MKSIQTVQALLYCLFMLALQNVAANPAQFELALNVNEPSGIARFAEPISGGIPLPAGKFLPNQPYALFADGREIAVQVIPTVIDANGFVRWILIDFQTQLQANQKKAFTLKAQNPKAQTAHPIQLVDELDGIKIDNGIISFRIARNKPFGIFEQAARGKETIISNGVVSYTDAFDKKQYIADKPTSIAVEYVGPMRTTLVVRGGFKGDDHNDLSYIARITAWANRSDVHLKYSLSNSNSNQYSFRQIQDSNIVLKLATPASKTILGARKPMTFDGNAWMHQGLNIWDKYQEVQGHTKVGNSAGIQWSGNGRNDKVQGWLATENVLVVDRYFADDPARKLATQGDTIVLRGIAEKFSGPMDAKYDSKKPIGEPYGDQWRWIMDSSHLSSQYRIDLGPPANINTFSAQATAVRDPIHVLAPAAWYFATESLAVGKFGTQEDELAAYDRWGWKYNRADVPSATADGTTEKKKFQWRWVRGANNHDQTEYDIVEALLLMYLRTGSYEYYTALEAWANYHMDLLTWRTDDWHYKDGGVWWPLGGPIGNRPQRKADPVTGAFNKVPSPRDHGEPFDQGSTLDLWSLSYSKQCYCHSYGAGLAAWFSISGDRDALAASIDSVEQQIDTQRRAFRKEPGKSDHFHRDFTRAVYHTNAVRMVVPSDPFVVEASDWLTETFLRRPNPEPRGMLAPIVPLKMSGWQSFPGLEKYVGQAGIDKMKALGVSMSPDDGLLTHHASGTSWYPILNPISFMFPPMSTGLEAYYRLTGNEDVHDWVIAYGQSTARVLFQEKHGNFDKYILADFPIKGWAWDRASWQLPETSKHGEGVVLSGYLANMHADVVARAYSLTGDPFLKQRAYDYWFYGTHRGYKTTKLSKIDEVASWVNVTGLQSETVRFSGRTIYEHANPRKDEQAPTPITNLQVQASGNKITVSFDTPLDTDGQIVRYQLKSAKHPIVPYQEYVSAFNDNTSDSVTNWWMAHNLTGEPQPSGPKEQFSLANVPLGHQYFAIVSYDDSGNRSAISNVFKLP